APSGRVPGSVPIRALGAHVDTLWEPVVPSGCQELAGRPEKRRLRASRRGTSSTRRTPSRPVSATTRDRLPELCPSYATPLPLHCLPRSPPTGLVGAFSCVHEKRRSP